MSTRPSHHTNDTKTGFRNPWDVDESESEPADAIEAGAGAGGSGGWAPNLNFNVSNWMLPSLLSQGWAGFPLEWETKHGDHPHPPVKVVKPDFGIGKAKDLEGSGGGGGYSVKATWLGHATYLVELPSSSTLTDSTTVQVELVEPPRILFDPIFSERAGPSQCIGTVKRLPSPCKLEDLPEFQFVVISHNHYDHLDYPSIMAIHTARGRGIRYLVPLGNKSWFVESGIPEFQIFEMDWWDEIQLPVQITEDNRGGDDGDGDGADRLGGLDTVKFICTPAQHGSRRTGFDTDMTLWASWVVETRISVPRDQVKNENERRVAVYFAGDTGYITSNEPCPVFKEIGQKYGPFDLSMIPIWRGGSLQFLAWMGLKLTSHTLTSSRHCSPREALSIHTDTRSRHSLAMHFATFAGSDVEAFEPIVELSDEKEVRKIGNWWEEGGFGVVDVGETAVVEVLVSEGSL